MFSVVYILIGLAVGGIVTFTYFFVRDRWFASTARIEAKRIIEDAKNYSGKFCALLIKSLPY